MSRDLKYCLAQIGARKNYVALQALSDLGWLDTFCTDLYYGSLLSQVMQLGARLTGRHRESNAISSRTAGEVKIRQVVDYPWFAVRNRMRVKKAHENGDPHRAFISGGSEFAGRVAQALSFEQLDGVYSFSSASLEIFERADTSVCKVLDHETPPACLEAALVRQANERFADWSSITIEHDTSAVLGEYQTRQLEEAKLADIVVCPSSFAADLCCQAGVEAEKIRVLPFAMASRFSIEDQRATPKSGDRLKVLFLGNDAIRKGLPDLIEALELLASRSASLTDARGGGAWSLTDSARHRCERVMTVLGGVPRKAVVDQYAWADVFVMPTASDAMGVVILEAMAAGVPVITTTASGGPDLIRDGIDGFVVPVGNPELIAEKLEQIHRDRDLLVTMSRNASERAGELARNYPRQLAKVLESGNRSAK